MEFARNTFLLSIFFMLGFLLAPGVTTHADRGFDLVGVEAKQSGLQDLSLISSAPSPLEASERCRRSAASAAPRSVDRASKCNLTIELYDAAWKGNLKNVKRFLDYGADPNALIYGLTPLHVSAEMGHATVVQLLLQRGADVNISTTDKWTALHIAANVDRKGLVVLLLLNKGADLENMNKQKQTPLHFAAIKNNALVVRLLVEWGASKDATDSKGKIPLDYARGRFITPLLHP